MKSLQFTVYSLQKIAERSTVILLSTNNYQLTTMLTNIILFNHSFGGLSPPKAARAKT